VSTVGKKGRVKKERKADIKKFSNIHTELAKKGKTLNETANETANETYLNSLKHSGNALTEQEESSVNSVPLDYTSLVLFRFGVQRLKSGLVVH